MNHVAFKYKEDDIVYYIEKQKALKAKVLAVHYDSDCDDQITYDIKPLEDPTIVLKKGIIERLLYPTKGEAYERINELKRLLVQDM